MTEAEINIAMAKVAGWRVALHESGHWGLYTPSGTRRGCWWTTELGAWTQTLKGTPKILNFTGSLDAVVPVVRGMPKDERDDVMIELMHIADNSDHDMSLSTPLQWCEAVLRKKGLWK